MDTLSVSRARPWGRSAVPLAVAALLTSCSEASSADGASSTGEAGKTTTQAAVSPPTTAVDRAAIMRASGYVQRGGRWMGNCGEAGAPDPDGWYEVEIDFVRDLNEDGRPEALIAEGGSSYCYGNAGYGYTLLTRTESGWRALIQSEQGMPTLFDRPGLAWPDIEIGMPGSNCFSFLRWNGREYAYAGKSIEGRICELDPAFAQAAPPAPARGGTGFPPIPKGYYAFGMSCARAVAAGGADSPPDNLALMDEDSFAYADGGPQVQGYESLGGDRYRVRARAFGNGDDAVGSPADFTIRVTGPASFQTETPVVTYTHCPTSQVSRDIRESWFEFGDE